MGNLRDEDKLRNMQPTDVVLGADEDGCLVNFPPDNFSGSIPISIDTETGDGEELFTEPSVNDFLFKKLKSNDESVDVTTDVDGNINLGVTFPTPPTVDYPVIESEDLGNGVSLRASLNSKKIPISTLKSDNFIITKEEDGSVKINSVGGGSVSNDWYLDANFVRPLNWNTPQNPKEQISGQPVANGTLNDPFKTYEEYLLKRIYGVGGSGTGTASKFNPKYPVKTLQILSDITIENTPNMEVVNTTLYLRNFITITYKESVSTPVDYPLDYANIFDSLTSGGNLPFAVTNTIKGEGTITRDKGFGLIRHKTNSAKTANGNFCLFNIEAEGKGLYFIEGENTSIYTALTNASDNPLKYGGTTVLGTNTAPSTPLISIEGTNNGYWSSFVMGTKIYVKTKTQIGIRCYNNGRVTSSAERFVYQVDNLRVGYITRLTSASSGTDLDIVNYYENADNSNGKVYYKAHETYSVFRAEDTSKIRIENIATEENGFDNTGANSVISLTGTAIFENPSSANDLGGSFALNFIKTQGSATTISFNNALLGSKYFNFIKGDGTNSQSIDFVNSRINPRNISTDLTSLSVQTNGSWSSVKKIPINTGIVGFVDNAAAVSAGYITGMSYFNTTENAISRVS